MDTRPLSTRARIAILLVGTSLLLAARPSPGQAQELPPWTGTYTTTGKTWVGWDESLSGSFTFAYVGYTAGTPGAHRWTLSGGTFSWEASGNVLDCPVTGSLSGTLQPGPDGDVGDVIVYDDGTYFAEFIFDADRTHELVEWHCPVGLLKNNGQISTALYTETPRQVKENGTTLSERMQGEGQYSWLHFDWNLTSQAIPETELVFSADPAIYATWLPTAGKNETDAGSPMTITATLRNTDGSPLTRKAVAFLFELVDVSREPGIALNYPKANPQAGFDLTFTGSDSEILLIDPLFAQFIAVAPQEVDGTQTATVVVSPYDFGAWGAVKVKATLGGGDEPIVGTLETNSERTQLLLPWRDETSRIAAAWKQAHGVPASSDADDVDALPAGDGHAGDGLTLYEEYRGFRIGGMHRRTNPKRKTMLIHDAVGGAVKQGTQLYRQITGLEVYDRLLPSEFNTTTRVVNRNHGEGPHVVDQHGIYIKEMTGTVGRAVGTGPGTPKHTEYVRLGVLAEGVKQYVVDGHPVERNPLARHVAHELLHASSVWHHGEHDRRNVVWTLDRDPVTGRPRQNAEGDWIILENGTPIHPQWEGGGTFIPGALQFYRPGQPIPSLRIPFLAWLHGQHSGSEACVMRYHVATWSGRATGERFYAGSPELPGNAMCRSPLGTGVNAPDHPSRHGDADQASPTGRPVRGNCASQLCINDRYH